MPLPATLVIDNPPVQFERRDIGSVLETEVTISPDGTLIELQLAVETVRHHGFWRWSTGPDEHSACVQSYSFQPDFSRRKTSTKLSLANGRREMLSFHKLEGPDDRVEIALIRAVSKRVLPGAKFQ